MSELKSMELELRREKKEAVRDYKREIKELQEQVANEAKAYRAMHK